MDMRNPSKGSSQGTANPLQADQQQKEKTSETHTKKPEKGTSQAKLKTLGPGHPTEMSSNEALYKLAAPAMSELATSMNELLHWLEPFLVES